MTALKPNGGDSNPCRVRAPSSSSNPDADSTPSIPIRKPGRTRTLRPVWRERRDGVAHRNGSIPFPSPSAASRSLALRELDGPLMFGRSFRDRPIQQRGASTSKSATNAGTSNWL